MLIQRTHTIEHSSGCTPACRRTFAETFLSRPADLRALQLQNVTSCNIDAMLLGVFTELCQVGKDHRGTVKLDRAELCEFSLNRLSVRKRKHLHSLALVSCRLAHVPTMVGCSVKHAGNLSRSGCSPVLPEGSLFCLVSWVFLSFCSECLSIMRGW